MSRILSWKINSDNYAYLFKVPGTNSHISERIPTDSSVWSNSDVLSCYTCGKDEYKSRFDSMSSEVSSKFNVTLTYKEDYYSENKSGGGTIVLLTGADGIAGDKTIGSTDIGPEVYEEFNNMIDQRLAAKTAEILQQNEVVKEFITSETQKTIAEAKQTLEETKTTLNEVRGDLEERLSGATEALNKAAALFEMGDGNIDPKDIQDALTSVKEYDNWMEEYSGSIVSLKSDYDWLEKNMGSIGEAEDVPTGFLSKFATSLNTVENTVGNVERWMSASSGVVGDMASWYGVNSGIVSEVTSVLNAMSGEVRNTVNYINGSGLTEHIERKMSAVEGNIKDSILMSTESAITNVTREMNAFSASIVDTITTMNSDSAITSMGKKMEALEEHMSEWMTKTDSAMSIAYDLRDDWTIENGKLSTVANLTAKRDSNGDIIYWASGAPSVSPVRVWRQSDGKWYDTQNSTNGNEYKDAQVYVEWSTEMASYIQQQSSAITLSVMNDSGLTAAIKAGISEDEAFITMVAQTVYIDADVIAKAISAKTANIGGIMIGNGIIECMARKHGKPYFSLDGTDGSLYAQNAHIEGAITATTLKIGSTDIDDYIDDRVPSNVPTTGDIEDLIGEYLESEEFESILENQGYVTQKSFDEWVSKQSGMTPEQVSALCNTLIEAAINIPDKPTQDGSGGTIHTITIGGKKYSWTTYETDDYIVFGTKRGDGSGGTGTSFVVSKDGLMEANNAVIYGAIYASEGYFQGDVTARTLTIGEKSIDSYIDSRVPSDTPTMSDIQGIIGDYLQSKEFEDILGEQGYVTQESFNNWIQNQSGMTPEAVSAICNTLIGASINIPKQPYSDGSGGTVHTVTIGGQEYSWTTIDGGDFLVLDTKVSGASGTTIISKNGLLQANNAIIYGEIHAQKGKIGDLSLNRGALSGTNFHLSSTGLRLRGSIRQPFIEYDSSFYIGGSSNRVDVNDIADNYYLPYGSHTLPSLKYTPDQIGRRVTLVNNRYGVHESFRSNTMTLPTGYYFYEDGFQTNSLTICNEVVELLGYGNYTNFGTSAETGEFYGWIVLNRFNIVTQKVYGHDVRALCYGTINMANGTVKDLTSCDGTTYKESGSTYYNGTGNSNWFSSDFGYVSTKRVANGEYIVRIPDRWFASANTSNINEFLSVQLTPKALMNACYLNTSQSGFTIQSSKSEGDIEFMIFNKGDWASLPKIFTVELSVNTTYVVFNNTDSGESCKQTINIKTNPSNATISYTTTHISGQKINQAFEYNVQTSGTNKTITVFPKYTNYGGWSYSTQPNSFTINLTLKYNNVTKNARIDITQRGYYHCSNDYYTT